MFAASYIFSFSFVFTLKIIFIVIVGVIITSINSLSSSSSAVHAFKLAGLYPLPTSPIATTSTVKGPTQCKKDAAETYAACGSLSNAAVKFNLRPFSCAVVGPTASYRLFSCDLYDTGVVATSRVVCPLGYDYTSWMPVNIYYATDLSSSASPVYVQVGGFPHVAVHSPSATAYVSSASPGNPQVFKINGIDGTSPSQGGTVNLNAGDQQPHGLIVADNFLFVSSYSSPARLIRIDLTIPFAYGTMIQYPLGGPNLNDYLASDNTYIYDLTGDAYIFRSTYKTTFAVAGYLKLNYSGASSLSISPDLRFLFVTLSENVTMVRVRTLRESGVPQYCPKCHGGPIATSWGLVYAGGREITSAYAFEIRPVTTTQSITSADSASATSSGSETVSADTRSVSEMETETFSDSLTKPPTRTRTFSRTPVADRSATFSLSESSMRSMTVSESATADRSITFTPPPTPTPRRSNSSEMTASTTLLATETPTIPLPVLPNPLIVFANVVNSLTLVASAAAVSTSPSVGFGLARQQAKVNFLAQIKDGNSDCSGISEVEAPAVDSPTQFQIGSSDARYFVGGAVGNVILTGSLVIAVQIGGYIYMRKASKSAWKRSPFVVFARCHGAMVLFILVSMLFAPSIKFGLVVIALDPKKIEGLTIAHKIIAFVFGVIIYGGITIYYAIRFLFLRKRKEGYEMLTQDEIDENTKNHSAIRRFYDFLFEGPGEWKMPKEEIVIIVEDDSKKKKHKKKNAKERKKKMSKSHILEFEAANPLIEGFRKFGWHFAFFEFFIQVGLAVGEFLAQVVEKEQSCRVQGITLIVMIAVHMFFSLAVRPFQEKFNLVIIPVLDLLQVVTLILGVYYVGAGEMPEYVNRLGEIGCVIQTVIALILFVASWDPLIKASAEYFEKQEEKKRRKEEKKEEEKLKKRNEKKKKKLGKNQSADKEEDKDVELMKPRI